MREDAVAPVVAAMLVLAVAVTFFAAWNAYYVPSMKAQSEITHLKSVESDFLQFSSDIGIAASTKNDMQLSESIPLGGGDFTFDEVKSGGLLMVRNDREGYMRVTVTNGTAPLSTSNLLWFSNYSYQPVSNFWQDQGYDWSYGNVNVSQGALTTPLQYTGMDKVTYGITDTLFGLDSTPSEDIPGACSLMDVNIVNITADTGNSHVSGNDNGMLVLESTVITQQFANATGLTVSINPGMPEGFRNALWNAVYQRVNESLICGNVHVFSDPSNLTIQVAFDPIPNMTLNRKITEISIGAH